MGTRHSAYRTQAITLSDILTSRSFDSWLTAPSQFHVKIYSLSFAALGPFLGNNVLTLEPLNHLFHLLTVVLVFKLGQCIFDSRVGLTSAGVISVWPSFLLHSTQTLKDPLLTIGL
jgi:4-amino-4-deoxy-L-arabinose transferase-like glycosyltransferase